MSINTDLPLSIKTISIVENSAKVDVNADKVLKVLQIFVKGRKLINLDGVRDLSDTQVTLRMKWK